MEGCWSAPLLNPKSSFRVPGALVEATDALSSRIYPYYAAEYRFHPKRIRFDGNECRLDSRDSSAAKIEEGKAPDATVKRAKLPG